MILYFDSYIIEQSLWNKSGRMMIYDEITKGGNVYKKESRYDIAKYTLESYAMVNWSNILIKYELADQARDDEFYDFVRNLFPKAVIFRRRSSKQQDFIESYKVINKWDDEWIFYSPNNDHPIVINNADIFDKLIAKANKFENINNNFVSIYYSHFTEAINSAYKGNSGHIFYKPKSKIIDEDEDCVVIKDNHFDFTSAQILHKDLFYNWFLSSDLKDRRIIRSDDLDILIPNHSQIQVIPKMEICRHFETYFHTYFATKYKMLHISPDKVPPLFIPPGYFDKRIRIAYGYDNYRHEWVNVNPVKEKYSFRDNVNGTDLKCTIEDLPFSWKDRIVEIDKNSQADDKLLKMHRDKYYETLRYPWSDMPKFQRFFCTAILKFIGKVRNFRIDAGRLLRKTAVGTYIANKI